MADLSISLIQSNLRADFTGVKEDVGQNLMTNGYFETAPAFTAATNVTHVWIDGTAAGNTNFSSPYSWGISSFSGSNSAQFDTSVFDTGTTSLKVSTLATASTIGVRLINAVSTVILLSSFGIPCYSSTNYTVTYSMKTTANSGSATTGAQLQILTYAANSISALQTVNGNTGVTTTTNWTQYTKTFTTNASAAVMMINLQVVGNDGTATLIMDAWFDSIQLQANTPNGNLTIPITPIVTPGVQDISGPKIWS